MAPMQISMDDNLSVKQAYLVMFAFLERQWESLGRPEDLGVLLGELALWETSSGAREPMDRAVFPSWLDCVRTVLEAEFGPGGFGGANVALDGEATAGKSHT